MFNLPGYQCVRNNRTGRKGGGVALYIKEHFQYKIREDIIGNINTEFESIYIEVDDNFNKIVIGEIYRVQCTNVQTFLQRYQDYAHPVNF